MLRFELGNKGKFIDFPQSANEVNIDSYVYGLFSLLRRSDYIRKDGYAIEALSSYAERVEMSLKELIKKGKASPNVHIEYKDNKDRTQKVYLHTALDWLYRIDKDIEIVISGVQSFYVVDESVMKRIKFGAIGGLNKKFHGKIDDVTVVDLFRSMVNIINSYKPKLRLDKDCVVKHQGKKLTIPVIHIDKVMMKKRLPELTTLQVLKAMKIEYRMNREAEAINDMEEVFESGNVGWENLANNELQKVLKKLALFLVDKKDSMPLVGHKLDAWIDKRMYFLGGYDKKGERTKESIKMDAALDCLFFLARIGWL
jgi:hypothetical protein